MKCITIQLAIQVNESLAHLTVLYPDVTLLSVLMMIRLHKVTPYSIVSILMCDSVH